MCLKSCSLFTGYGLCYGLASSIDVLTTYMYAYLLHLPGQIESISLQRSEREENILATICKRMKLR